MVWQLKINGLLVVKKMRLILIMLRYTIINDLNGNDLNGFVHYRGLQRIFLLYNCCIAT
jgi:hypothetical protein